MITDQELMDMPIADLRILNRKVFNLINARNRQEQQLAKASFYQGDKVYFNHSRTGERIEGNVRKVCRVNIQVDQTNGRRVRWTVSPKLLRMA